MFNHQLITNYKKQRRMMYVVVWRNRCRSRATAHIITHIALAYQRDCPANFDSRSSSAMPMIRQRRLRVIQCSRRRRRQTDSTRASLPRTTCSSTDSSSAGGGGA